MDGLSKTKKNLSQYSQSLGRDLNPGPPEYEAGMFLKEITVYFHFNHLRILSVCHFGMVKVTVLKNVATRPALLSSPA
jgi:hypothetical protein